MQVRHSQIQTLHTAYSPPAWFGGTTSVGDLYFSWQNAAHMKFTELTRPHVEYTDAQIQHKLESLQQSHS